MPPNKGMLHRKVRPLVIDPMKKKGTSHKQIVEEVQNQGQEFSAAGRTDVPTRVEKQAVKIPKPPRSQNH